MFQGDDDGNDLQSQKTGIEQEGGWTGPINRQINRTRSTEDLQAEEAEREAVGKSTQQIRDELHSRPDPTATRSSLEAQKRHIESQRGWTGGVNRQINRGRSSDDLRAERDRRREQNLPTGQLDDELNSRGE